MTRIDQRIAAYITELSTETVVSYSHRTLRTLYILHGKALIDELVADYFKEQNDTRARLAASREETGDRHENASTPRTRTAP